jgi:hypothetical protein
MGGSLLALGGLLAATDRRYRFSIRKAEVMPAGLAQGGVA